MKKGFTLIELLIYISIFVIAVIFFIVIFIAFLHIQAQQSGQSQVNQESQFLLQQLQYDIESARLADMPLDTATGTLTLREYSSSQDPTLISLGGGVVSVQQGAGSPQSLSSGGVVVSNLSFARHFNIASSSALGSDSISFTFTVMVNTSNTEKQYSQSYESSALVLTPVPKIALIQKVKNDTAATTTSIAATYGSSNEAGDLLVAVVGEGGLATSSISDTAGNAWTLAASTSYSAYNEKMIVFDALNAKASANTVTASFGVGANPDSIFLYEYRGASASSSFDASSSQLQPNTKTPTSGNANATSSAELVMGINYNGSTSEIPAAGLGFLLETTSSVSSLFVEDQPLFITSPVAANWQYTTTAVSSSAMVLTFK